MTDDSHWLTLLQHADSFFPGGTIAFSYGLETCVERELVKSAQDLECFLRDQLSSRWSSFDRNVTANAWQNASDMHLQCELDYLVEAMTLPMELREGSKRNGRALLTVHSKLHTPLAAEYQERVAEGSGLAHVSVMQGMLWQALEFSLPQTLTLSGHSLCVAILGAALRLGVIGHIHAQSIRSNLNIYLADLIEQPVASIHELQSFSPIVDIAVMQHETQFTRLFSN